MGCLPHLTVFGFKSLLSRKIMLMDLQRRLNSQWALAISLVAMIMAPAHATPVTIDWVTVGDAGNANDTTGYGAVTDEYRIMKFEWTNSQYVQFLNAVDPSGENPNGVYDVRMGTQNRGGITFSAASSAGSKYAEKPLFGDKPVNYVSWFRAARVSNWLHNGQGSGSTETGAYTLNNATSGDVVAKNAGARYWIPSENEWYKAAYYNPALNGGAGGYTLYANGFDLLPETVTANSNGDGSAGSTGNFANYNGAADWGGRTGGNPTTVGTNGAASYYGAFDMNGNMAELNSLTGAAGPKIGLRGGDYTNFLWANTSVNSRSDTFNSDTTSTNVGFRLVAVVPEPSTWVMGLAGIACGGWGMWRRRKRTAA